MVLLFFLFQNGLRGNLETLITLYADKFYTYEDDVFEALESIRVRQVGEMQAQLLQQVITDHRDVKQQTHSSTLRFGSHKQHNADELNDFSCAYFCTCACTWIFLMCELACSLLLHLHCMCEPGF